MMELAAEPLTLALSGGGVRAMAFHAGVLRFLAERGALESVSHVSTVSGGSLLVALLYRHANMQWPSSQAYLTSTLPAIRTTLTTIDLQRRAIRRLILKPTNWRFVLSRANVVAEAIAKDWGIDGALKQIPETPAWSINGTTAETGRRFRFKADKLGDYELGYANAPDFPIASAAAVSAAFPFGIGPLAVTTSDYSWEKRPAWGAPETDSTPITLKYDRLHVYDGGVYDNLGLEPLFNIGAQKAKVVGKILLSDAGSPLPRGFGLASLSPSRLKRLFGIVMDQTRSLRVRVFVNYLQSNPDAGAYFQIGSDAVERLEQYSAGVTNRTEWLTRSEIQQAAGYPTNLKMMTPDTFDLLARHGYETARWNQCAFRFLSKAATNGKASSPSQRVTDSSLMES